MNYIIFTDGTKITKKEAADLIRQEGQLGIVFSKNWITGRRNVIGVLEGTGIIGSYRKIRSQYLRNLLKHQNDSFYITPKLRAKLMADWIERMK